MRRRARLATVALGAALTLAACETGGGATEYGQDVQENFVGACTAAGGEEATCACAYDAISEEYEFEEFRDIEESVEDGGEVPAEVSELFARCAAGGQGPLPPTSESEPGTGDSSTTTTEG